MKLDNNQNILFDKIMSNISLAIKNILCEAADSTFSYNQLDKLNNKEKLSYCNDHLGEPIGEGSSRLVFQIDDNKVLKLAKNKAGLYQNKWENNFYEQLGISDIFPQIYKCGSDYSYIVSDFVLPAKEEDFREVFKMSYGEFYDNVLSICILITDMHKSFKNNGEYMEFDCMPLIKRHPELNIRTLITTANNKFKPISEKAHETIIKTAINHVKNVLKKSNNTQFISNFLKYCFNENTVPGDLLTINNWGLTLKNNKLSLVILDAGWINETMDIPAVEDN